MIGHILAIAPWALTVALIAYGLSFDVRRWLRHRHQPDTFHPTFTTLTTKTPQRRTNVLGPTTKP